MAETLRDSIRARMGLRGSIAARLAARPRVAPQVSWLRHDAIQGPDMPPERPGLTDLAQQAGTSALETGATALRGEALMREQVPGIGGALGAIPRVIGGALSRGAEAIAPDPSVGETFEGKVASGFGSSLALAPAALAGPLGVAAAGAQIGGTQGYEAAQAAGAGPGATLGATLGEAALGATEAFGVGRALSRFGLRGGGAKTVLRESIEEALQEGGQSIGSDVVAGATYDPGRPVDFGRAGESALAAGAVGGIVSGGAAVLSRRRTGGEAPAPASLSDLLSREDVQRTEPLNYAVSESGTEAAPRGKAVYHGSPHAFDRFDTDAVGSGEGTQAQGHGIYFTDKKEIAEHYRDIDPERYGLTYQAEIAPADDELLLWDKPVTAQSRRVRSALQGELEARALEEDRAATEAEAATPTASPEWGDFGTVEADAESLRRRAAHSRELARHIRAVASGQTDATARDAYKLVQGHDTQREASRRLRRAGVRGVKYLAGESREAGEGAHNYVVFDDADARVVARHEHPEFAAPAPPAQDLTGAVPAQAPMPGDGASSARQANHDDPLRGDGPGHGVEADPKPPEMMTPAEHQASSKLLPAIRFEDGGVIVGKPGDIHATIWDRAGAPVDRGGPESGWMQSGRFLTPDEAATIQGQGDARLANKAARSTHEVALVNAVLAGKPVLAESWDAYQPTVPKGYARVGDTYAPSPQPQEPLLAPDAGKGSGGNLSQDEWFAGSKVADEAGWPLTVYHGSRKRFPVFDRAHAGSATDAGYLGEGFYFGDRWHAGMYAGMSAEAARDAAEDANWVGAEDPYIPIGAKSALYPVHLSLKNPLVLNEMRDPEVPRRTLDREKHIRDALGLPRTATARQVTDAAEAAGYDGVIFTFENPGGGPWPLDREYVAFRPESIRSTLTGKVLAATTHSAQPKGSETGPGALQIEERAGRQRSKAAIEPAIAAPAPPPPSPSATRRDSEAEADVVGGGVSNADVGTPSQVPTFSPGNPFAEKARRARALADSLSDTRTAHEKGMAEAFPLGAGFGRGSAHSRSKKIDASVNRAVRAVEAEKNARYLEAQASAYEAGEIDAQGRRITKESQARSVARERQKLGREERIAAAKAQLEGRERWEVPQAVYADSTGNLGGGARKLMESDHREYVERALAEGKPVPPEVLADYPDLTPSTPASPAAEPITEPEATSEAPGVPTADDVVVDVAGEQVSLDDTADDATLGIQTQGPIAGLFRSLGMDFRARPPASPGITATMPAQPGGFSIPEPRKMVRRLVDVLDRLSQLEAAAPNKLKGEQLAETLALFPGRTYGEAEVFDEKLVEPIRKAIRSGIAVDTSKPGEPSAGDFLYALAAPQANAVLEAEGRPPGSSGLDDAEAQRIQAEALKGPKAAQYRALQKANRAINRYVLDTLESSGLLSAAERQAWADKWGEDYVPFRNAPTPTPTGETIEVRSSGFNVRGKESKRRKGRRSKAANPLAMRLATAASTISRANKNRVGQRVADLVEANPIPGYWRVETDANKIKPDEIKLAFKRDGQQQYIVTNDPELGHAFKRLGEEPGALKYVDPAMRWLSKMATENNPVFWLYNVPRDVLGGALKLSIEESTALAKRVAKNAVPALIGARRHLAGKKGGRWSKVYEEARDAGALIGWKEQFDFQEMLGELRKVEAPPLKRTAAMIDTYRRLNRAAELGTRLATFDAALAAGKSKTQAAMLARRVSIDFARRGSWTPVLRRLYLFANPGVQGFADIARATAKHPERAAAVFGALIFHGYLRAHLSRLFGGEDDNGEAAWDTLTEYEKAAFWGVMVDGTAYGLPSPPGFNWFDYLGVTIEKMAHGRGELKDAARDLTAQAADSFSPLQGDEPLMALTPSLARPFAEVEANRDFADRAIYPEKNPFDKAPPADSHNVFDGRTNPTLAAAAQGINRVTGGSKYEPGLVDVHPDSIGHLLKAAGSGAGTAVGRALNVFEKLVRGEGEDIRLADIPGLRAFVKQPSPAATGRIYREHIRDFERARKKDKDGLTLSDGDRRSLDLEADVKAAERQIAKLRDDIDAETDPAARKALFAEIRAEQAALNRAFAQVARR